MSDCIGKEKTSRQSSDRRARLGRVVYDTLHIAREMLKCLPRIAMWANCSSASLLSTTSSIRMRTLRVMPFSFNDSCCLSRASIRPCSHWEKKNRSSQFWNICSFKTGLHEALPMNAIIRSNLFFMISKSEDTALLFPILLPPHRARLNGIFVSRRRGSHWGSISLLSSNRKFLFRL